MHRIAMFSLPLVGRPHSRNCARGQSLATAAACMYRTSPSTSKKSPSRVASQVPRHDLAPAHPGDLLEATHVNFFTPETRSGDPRRLRERTFIVGQVLQRLD